jgi:diacylglycerol kinase family enzyme
MSAEPAPDYEPLTPHVRIERVEAVVNPASGGVNAKATAELEALLQKYDLKANVTEAKPTDLADVLKGAVEAGPDLLIVLAGDGTIRAAGELCGPEGPILAALPGGTMNMLPQALYGTTDWRKALAEALTGGEVRNVCGGKVEDMPFYCAAIIGHPALWAEAREALRERKLRHAFIHARSAMRRTFSGRLRYYLDGGLTERAEAVAFLTPLISKALGDASALEAAAMDVSSAGEAFRMAVNALVRDWRDDPAVEARPARRAVLTARRGLPAILDGELVRLGRRVEVTFLPKAFRALAPRLESVKT